MMLGDSRFKDCGFEVMVRYRSGSILHTAEICREDVGKSIPSIMSKLDLNIKSIKCIKLTRHKRK